MDYLRCKQLLCAALYAVAVVRDGSSRFEVYSLCSSARASTCCELRAQAHETAYVMASSAVRGACLLRFASCNGSLGCGAAGVNPAVRADCSHHHDRRMHAKLTVCQYDHVSVCSQD